MRSLAKRVLRRCLRWFEVSRNLDWQQRITSLQLANVIHASFVDTTPLQRRCSCDLRNQALPVSAPILLERVNVWPAYGVASDRTGRIILETAASEYRLRRLVTENGLSRPKWCKSVGAVVAAIEHGFMWDNYYHWLIDSLPRVFWLHRPEVASKLPGPVTLYVHRFARGSLRELLETLLPPGVKVQECDSNCCIPEATYLHLPPLSHDYCGWLPWEYITMFRDNVRRIWKLETQGAPRLLYLSRQSALKRRILNDQEISAYLSKCGFETVMPERMNLAEQARLFYNCSVVVAPHGAGLTNIIYARACTVIELFPGPELGHYRELSRALGHYYLKASFGYSHKNDDFLVDKSVLAQLLREATVKGNSNGNNHPR